MYKALKVLIRFCERDLGSLPAGREDLEAAGEHLAQYLGGL